MKITSFFLVFQKTDIDQKNRRKGQLVKEHLRSKPNKTFLMMHGRDLVNWCDACELEENLHAYTVIHPYPHRVWDPHTDSTRYMLVKVRNLHPMH